MTEIASGIQLFKPSGETIDIPGDQVESIGKHEFMGGSVIWLQDGTVIHTNLPFLLQTDAEKMEDVAQKSGEEEEGEE